jgi:CheY-like chemotaxis protein
VVDDESEILKAMQDLLEYLGYKPLLAANGIKGLEKYKSKNPDAVLMDINMPEMDGITCIEKILNHDPNANISIFSGYEEEGVEGMSQRAKDSIKDYLAKPVGLEALSALLAKMLKGNE